MSDNPYRRHPVVLPEDFDQWFTVNHFIPNADGAICHTGDVPSDKVVCTLQLHRVLIDHPNYNFVYSLMLYVEVPESSGLDLAHLFSPIVTIARYLGDSADINAPQWTCMPRQMIFDFHQPRHIVAELFFKLALSADNLTPSNVLRSDMLNWASAIRWGPRKASFVYDYTDRHAPKALQSFVAPCYRADQSLKAALKDVKNHYGSGPDEVIIIEVSSDE